MFLHSTEQKLRFKSQALLGVYTNISRDRSTAKLRADDSILIR